jgi:hypothetical protein
MGKPKKVLFELIKPDQVFLSGQPYKLLAEIRAEQHFDTADAKIALAWKKGTKPDADGHLVLGCCMRASDLQRELVDYDFVIVLNQEVWEDPEFDRGKKLALLDHEMMHAARSLDADGEPVIDSKNRPVWRVRGHDIEEFTSIIARHGCYKRDLEKFAEALLLKKKQPLFTMQSSTNDLAQDPKFTAAVDRLASSVRIGEVEQLTVGAVGMDPVVIDKQTAENIHHNARRGRKRPEA